MVRVTGVGEGNVRVKQHAKPFLYISSIYLSTHQPHLLNLVNQRVPFLTCPLYILRNDPPEFMFREKGRCAFGGF